MTTATVHVDELFNGNLDRLREVALRLYGERGWERDGLGGYVVCPQHPEAGISVFVEEPRADSVEFSGCERGCAPEQVSRGWAQKNSLMPDVDDWEPESRTSWAPVDLTRLLAGEALEDPPEYLIRRDGPGLLYRGRLHLAFGEPESCKGWLALHAARERLEAGEKVLYIDFEDTAASVVARLLDLGSTAEAVAAGFAYIRPNEPLGDDGIEDIEKVLEQGPSLVVVDGLTEALALEGLELKDNGDVARWLELLPRRLARSGAAVLLIDHVAKDRESRGRFAIGAQHKLAGVDVAYALEVIEPFGRERDGLVRVNVKKDRPGHVRQHAERDRVALVRLRSRDGQVSIELDPPEPGGEEFRPTVLMERLSRFVEAEAGATKNAIRTGVTGNSAAKDMALRLLVDEGYIEPKTEGRAHLHYSLKPYREAADERHRAPVPQPCPDRAPGTVAGDRAPDRARRARGEGGTVAITSTGPDRAPEAEAA